MTFTQDVWKAPRLSCRVAQVRRTGALRRLGDTALAGRQRLEPAENHPARARTGGAELGVGVVGEGSGAGMVGGVECFAEQFSSFGAAIATPKQGAQVSEGARSFQPGVAT